MIESVSIKGFQSHVNSDFRLSPGLTVITGPTDSGKTAIIRAIRWVVFGEPSGESFVNESVGEATVQITLTNQVIIIKNRRKGKTAYGITYPNCKTQLFETAAVPDEIINILGITKQTFGDFEAALNFAYQLEAPFLISEPPSAGAKVLGKIAGTEVVDLAVKAVAKDTYAARQEITQANKDIERIEGDLLQYTDLEQVKEQLESCEFLLGRYDEKTENLAQLQNCRNSWQRSDATIKAQNTILEGLANIPELQLSLREIEGNQSRLLQMLTLHNSYAAQTTVINAKTVELAKLQNLDQLLEDVSLIDQAIERLNLLRQIQNRHLSIMGTLNTANKTLILTADIDVVANKLEAVTANIGQLTSLKELQQRYQASIAYIETRQKIINATATAGQAADLLISVQKWRERMQRLTELKSLYHIKSNTVQQAADKERAATKVVAEQQNLLDSLWAELKVCPLCGQPIMKGEKVHGC